MTMKYRIEQTTRFRKDLRAVVKRGEDVRLLNAVVDMLAAGQPLPQRNHDHALTGDRIGQRECHIGPDWLLVYRIHENVLILELLQTGTHSDLFR